MARITWTTSRLAHLRRMMAEGMTYREIGKRMGISRDSVRGAAREYGLMRPELYNRGPDWTRAEYDGLERMIAEGLTYRQIAEQLGRPSTAVRHAAYRLGMTKGPERRQRRLIYDYPTLVPIIRDLAEVQAMCLPQIVQRLGALGHQAGIHAMRYHLRRYEPALYAVIVSNAEARRARLNALRGLRTRKRSQQEAA